MSRAIKFINFAGILALIALCIAQWRENRRVNLEAVALERVRLDQRAKLVEQDKAIKGYMADLEEFRDRLVRAGAALHEAETKLAALTAERRHLIADRDKLITERDQLNATLQTWQTALAERDKAIKKLGEQLQSLTKDRNDAIAKFNDLAGKWNGLVKDLNEARSKGATPK